jgi:hypothetical protein
MSKLNEIILIINVRKARLQASFDSIESQPKIERKAASDIIVFEKLEI